MPDLSILVELADFYDVDIRDIIDGERKGEDMNKEEKERLQLVADYAETEKDTLLMRLRIFSIVGLVSLIAGLVIIPAYNEAPNIVHTVESLKAACPDVDYVVVNDCSGDDTAKICEEHGYTYLNLPINLGIGGGMQTGYRYAAENGYDIAIQMDGDGQHNAEYIPDLIALIEKGEADLVIGSRFINKEGFQTSGMRRAGINILNTVLRLCGHVRVTDATSGFRAASRGVITFFAHNYAQDYPEPESIIAVNASGFKVKEVPVIMNERTAGVSSISPWKSVYYMIKVTLAIVIYRIAGKKWR